MRKTFILTGINILLLFCIFTNLHAQYLLTGASYSQDFDGLGTVTSPALNDGNLSLLNSSLTGWYFNETGSGANTIVSAGTGSATTGDTYNFGIAAATDRALGCLQSGTVVPALGFYFTNNTGNVITSIAVSYSGEQWRLGTAGGRKDALHFQYSQNTISLTSGEWVDVRPLDFITPFTETAGVINGNAAGNKTMISATINGLYIPPGTSFFMRWSDEDAAGSDDGLAIDDFSFTASFAMPAGKYYRSAQSGNWSSVSSWESSDDNISWFAATEIPSSFVKTITIRNTHTISFSAFLPVDEIEIESGGTLNLTGGIMTVEEGPGYDINIQNGGVMILSSAFNPPVFSSNSAAININGGAIIRVSAAGLTSVPGAGIHASNFIYRHQSVLEYTLSGGFGSNGVTYFPDADAATVPVFRTTASSGIILVGSNASTVFNGVFECGGNATIRWQNGGNKIFRNGIRGAGNMDVEAASTGAAKFIINGTTAELGGTGTITTPAANGLEMGNGTTVTMNSSKTINGKISLLPGSYIELGKYNLTVSGTVSGGSANSYIRTADAGQLILNTVATAGKTFPVGHSYYNPVVIEKGSNHNWAVNVNDGVKADAPQGETGAVLVTWNITPSVNPPSGNADITFQFDRSVQTGSAFDTPPYNIPDNVQAWHRKRGYWLAAGSPSALTQVNGNTWAVKIAGLSDFSPYALSRILLPLPVSLISFDVVKTGINQVKIMWQLATVVSQNERFEIERSSDGSKFKNIKVIYGNEHNKSYSVTDDLQKGISYYRLKTVNAAGIISFSKVITIFNTAEDFEITAVSPAIIYTSLTISAVSSINREADFFIYDLQGRMVKHWESRLLKGNNVISVQLNEISGGMYCLMGRSGNLTANNFCFIKQ